MLSESVSAAAICPSLTASLAAQRRCTWRHGVLKKVSTAQQRGNPTTFCAKRTPATLSSPKPMCPTPLVKKSSSKLRATSKAAEAPSSKKILVLGGTGYVGSEVCRIALSRGYSVVSVSRRGLVEGSDQLKGVDWRKGDVVADPAIVAHILSEGGFDGVMHAIGMLLESDANKFASGSGSVPTPGSTYDQVTRQTALAAASAFSAACEGTDASSPPPFVFVSAAEAGWTQDPPVPFLVSYLKAKRAVEDELLNNYGASNKFRPVILRPSLVYSMDRTASLPAVGAFFLGNMLKLPGIDRPVLVETLAKAALKAMEDESVAGVQNFEAMEDLAAAL
uniref:NAD-dependent epimerase/dehydratase domain-containing protein n=1 Tax=Pyramimonas obovata TaxID=1411642 RepID=A0A7S0QX38_9CHLO